MRASRVGVAVGGGRVRVVGVRGARVVAATEAELVPGEGLEDAVRAALAATPLRRFPLPRVVVALGPSLAQTRRLTGLPAVDDRRVLAQIVREGASRFFLHGAAPLLTTGVRVEAPGTAWAAALDEPAARAAGAGCRAAGVAVDAFVPSVVALARALADGCVVWDDGAAAAEVEVAGGALVAVRRVAPGPVDGAAAAVVPALAALGSEAWRFADAYGAAVLPAAEPLAVRRGEGGRRREDVPPARLAVAAGAALGEAAAFDAARRSPTRALAELARALPEGSALVSLRVDSAGGTLVALAPRAAAALAPLERVPWVRAAEIAGPVTREVAAGKPVERVTVRFRLRAGRGR